jgi:subtilisin family serine protease
VAVFAGGRAYAEQNSKPTRADLSAAAAAGVAQRWERITAGAIFPAAIGYTTTLRTRETATRVGIDPHDTCASALDATLARLAKADGCAAVLRADYADELRGAVYTLGVLVFPAAAAASAFYKGLNLRAYPATALNAFAIPGTPAALFGDAARQAAAGRQTGPYVVLAVAGYADGRPANPADEQRASVFSPTGQLVSAVAAPLARPATVHCGTAEWTCDVSGAVPPPPVKLEQIRPEEMQILDQIQAPAAWGTSLGSGVTVAVLDTGVDANAADLVGSVRTGPDYAAGADPASFKPPLIHGTYIASLIAGHGSGPGDTLGVIGVAPRATILSVRVILDDGEPGLETYDNAPAYTNVIGKGIYYAVAHGALVINMSLGTQQPTAFMRAAVAYAVAKGVVVVASAGNDGTNRGFAPYMYPASFTGVIAVAAITANGTRASFSEQNAAVVLSAPGVNVLGAGPGGEYLDAAGTSPAAALVSGVAALIRSRYPGLSPALVEQALITSATHRPPGGYSTSLGFGEVDAVAALAAAARLAAAKPVREFAPDATFTAGSNGAGAAAPRPIQVVHRDESRIAGFATVSGAGAIFALAGLALLPLVGRRQRPPAPEPWGSEDVAD